MARPSGACWRCSASPRCSWTGPTASTKTTFSVFDDVLGRLIEEIETKARAELSAASRRSGMRRSRWCGSLPRMTISRSPARCWRSRRGSPRPTSSTSPAPKARPISWRFPVEPVSREPVTDVLVRRGDREVVHSVAQNRDAPFFRSELLDAGQPGGRRRRARREGRLAAGYSAASCSAICCSRRRKSCSSACWRPPSRKRAPRSSACSRRSRARSQPSRGRATTRRRARPSRRCAGRASSTKRNSSTLPRPDNTRKRSWRWRCCARCRSRWWIG